MDVNVSSKACSAFRVEDYFNHIITMNYNPTPDKYEHPLQSVGGKKWRFHSQTSNLYRWSLWMGN